MYKHILVPTDGSRLSAKAVKVAAGLAKKLGAKLTGVYVIPPYVPPMYGEAAMYVPEVTPKRYKDLAEKEAKKALAGDRDRGADRGRTLQDDLGDEGPGLGRHHRAPRIEASAISSSWPRTAGAASRDCCSAAKPPRCSPTPRYRCSSVARREGFAHDPLPLPDDRAARTARRGDSRAHRYLAPRHRAGPAPVGRPRRSASPITLRRPTTHRSPTWRAHSKSRRSSARAGNCARWKPHSSACIRRTTACARTAASTFPTRASRSTPSATRCVSCQSRLEHAHGATGAATL